MLLVKNGYLIDPGTNTEGNYDILIERDVIKDVQKRGSFSALKDAEVIDAEGKWITPGLIDLHVHLREPGFEWKETIRTGSQAAIMGGFTTICCMANTNPVNDCAEVTRYILEKAKQADAAKVLPIGAISLGLKGKDLAPLSEMRKAGCVAFSDDGEPVHDAGLMRRALEWAGMLGATLSCHEEDKSLSCGGCMNESALSYRLGLIGMPKVAEDVMVARDIELARLTRSKVHVCHVSSSRSVELIRRAKNDGINITAEVTPHHLTLDESAVSEYDANFKMSPPLREPEEVELLCEGLADGTIDAVASDHAPHELDSKRIEFARASFGILGLQTSLPLLLDLVKRGVISRMRAIASLTVAPATAFSLDAGRLQKGSPADLVIIDPDFRWSFERELVRSLSFNSPFIERELTGRAHTVIVNGRVRVENMELRN